MPSPAVEIEAAGRTLRVSNPDRLMYPATERTAAVTKLDVVTYYLSVAGGIMTAVHDRPTTLERWPKGVFEGVKMATRADSHGDAFYQKRVPKGAPGYVETARIAFPSGRPADEVSDRAGRRRLGGAAGHHNLPPVAGAAGRHRSS
jgi:DNA primase